MYVQAVAPEPNNNACILCWN